MGCNQGKHLKTEESIKDERLDPVLPPINKDTFDLTQHDEKIAQIEKSHGELKKEENLNRNQSSESLSAMMDRINNIHIASSSSSLPYRTVMNYAGLSKTGYAMTNPAKINQDRIIMFKDGGEEVIERERERERKKESYVFGCLDGHGTYGEEVSAHFQTGLIQKLPQHPLFNSSIDNLKIAISETIIQLERDLVTNKNIDGSMSGCTLCLCIIREGEVLVANVGDSRALLVKESLTSVSLSLSPSLPLPLPRPISSQSFSSSPSLSDLNIGGVVQLSRDHKADLMDENRRIIDSGGRVMFREFADGTRGPPRVYLGKEDIPGLAMSRSLGKRERERERERESSPVMHSNPMIST